MPFQQFFKTAESACIGSGRLQSSRDEIAAFALTKKKDHYTVEELRKAQDI